MSKNKLVIINSVDRINFLDTSNRFTVRIQPAITGASRVLLNFVVLPNSVYNITSDNNSITWDDGSVNTTLIPVGSYNTGTLATAVAAAMTAGGSQAYTVTYNATTYHYTISAAGSFSLMYEIPITGNIFPTMGYRYDANSLPATSHEGNAAVALNTSPFFIIRIDKIPFIVQTSQKSSNFGSFVVQTNANSDGTIINWSQYANFNEITNISVNIDVLFIELLDHNGEIANINDSDWSFGIQVFYD